MTLAWSHKPRVAGRIDKFLLPRRQCCVKEKCLLLGLCYIELPCSRVVVPCFCYHFVVAHSRKLAANSNRWSGELFHFKYVNVKWAILNSTVGYPMKISLQDG